MPFHKLVLDGDLPPLGPWPQGRFMKVLRIVKVDDEQMALIAIKGRGHRKWRLTVERGYGGTTPAIHLAGAAVEGVYRPW